MIFPEKCYLPPENPIFNNALSRLEMWRIVLLNNEHEFRGELIATGVAFFCG
jgi:hypothetical protein